MKAGQGDGVMKDERSISLGDAMSRGLQPLSTHGDSLHPRVARARTSSRPPHCNLKQILQALKAVRNALTLAELLFGGKGASEGCTNVGERGGRSGKSEDCARMNRREVSSRRKETRLSGLAEGERGELTCCRGEEGEQGDEAGHGEGALVGRGKVDCRKERENEGVRPREDHPL